MTKRRFVYLASPYDGHPAGREAAYIAVLDYMKYYQSRDLMSNFPFLFSPIVYGHHCESHRITFEPSTWLMFDLKILDNADELWILKIGGWEKSIGVAYEIGYALAKKIPIHYVSP